MAKSTARHRAANNSHAVRNTGIAAAAGAVLLGSVAPAHAAGGATETYSAPQTADYSVSNTAAATPAPAAQTGSAAAQSVSGGRAAVVNAAKAGLGGAYVWGGKSFKAWDCSGFVSYVYQQAGVNLTAYTMAMKNEVRPTANPQPGDIVFTNGYSHVGIYLGDGKMISALNPQQGTQITAVDGGGMMPVDGYYTAF